MPERAGEVVSDSDGTEYEYECWICKKRAMDGLIAGEMFYCSTRCMASDATLTPLEALTAKRTEEDDDGWD